MSDIILSDGQQAALDRFHQFILDPEQQVMVLSGYAGCGKSTLVSTLINEFPRFMRMARLISPDMVDYEVALTATTNKAAENLAQLSGMEVKTIHSFLELRVETNYSTGVSTLVPRNSNVKEDFLLFVDEASYIDSAMLGTIFERTKNCKIVFIGDPAQLTPVKATSTPVFAAGFPEARLTEVMRQAKGNPIIELATMFRNTVNSGEFFSFQPDGQHIQHLPRKDFNEILIQDFSREDWKYSDSKFLAWTNKRVEDYNKHIREKVMGDPHFQPGDYAVCNAFVVRNKTSIKNEQMVYITGITEDEEHRGVMGNWYTIDGRERFFMPKSLALKNARIKKAQAEQDQSCLYEIGQSWIDLRAAYACTINKSQGSTFGTVYIDLDDISRCNTGNQIARMLYVAVSRAKHQVFFTGDLV
jgi:hypothetical protein